MQATFQRRALINAVVLVVLVSGCTGSTSPAPRDPKRWPFAATSIWNMPIGDRAQFVPAHIEASKRIGNFAEEEVIVLEPRAPMVDLLQSNADWDRSRDRCTPEPSHNVIDRVPIPKDFVTEPKLGATDDNAAAILRADGRTLHQSQPLVCCANGVATTHYRFDDTDLYGDGIAGAHGGSGLSALGGTIRLRELVSGGTIRHAFDWMFCNAKGRLLHPESLSQLFARVVARSGLPKIRFHDLRHTHASLLVAHGIPIKVVTERLGHSHPAFTLHTYQHLLPGMSTEAATRFAGLVANAGR